MTREPWPPRPHDAANQEKLADGDDEIRSMAEALGWRESEGME
jgi:hypothetical protein